MSFDTTYQVKRLRAGSLTERVSIIVPTRTINALRGEEKSWSLLKSTWSHVEQKRSGSGEEMLGERLTAVQHTVFTIRYLQALDEEMLINYRGQYFEIDQIAEPVNERRKSFLQVYAFNRREPVEVIGKSVITPGRDQPLAPAFSFVQTAATGSDFDMSPNTPSSDAAKKYNLLYIFRGGLRQMEGTDYSIDGTIIRFTKPLRGEALIIHQYKEIEI